MYHGTEDVVRQPPSKTLGKAYTRRMWDKDYYE